MRILLSSSILVLSAAMALPAFALQASDPMSAWKTAPQQERSDLLDQLLGKQNAARAGVTKCLDETSVTPGHTDLPIREVEKACAATTNPERPV